MSQQLSNLHLRRYLNTDPKSKKIHIKKGNKDGEKNLPRSDNENFSNYELGLVADANSSWANYKRGQQFEINQANKKYKIEVQLKDESSDAEIENLQVKETNELQQYTMTNGPDSPSQKQLNDAHENSVSDVKRIRSLLNRPLNVQFVKPYMFFMIILAIIETPINRVAFELFFKESPYISLALAAAIGSIIVFFAHSCGNYLKNSTCKEIKPNLLKTYLFIIVISLFVLLLIWIIAQMRQEYIDIKKLGGQTPTLKGLQQGNALGELVTNFFRWDLGVPGYLLLLANLAIYSVGIIASYMRHDAHPSYEKATNIENNARKNRDEFSKDYNKKCANISKKYNDKVGNIRKESVTRDENLEEYKIEKENLEKEEDQHLNIVIAGLKKEILAYRQGSSETRKDPEPKYFSIIDDAFLKTEIIKNN